MMKMFDVVQDIIERIQTAKALSSLSSSSSLTNFDNSILAVSDEFPEILAELFDCRIRIGARSVPMVEVGSSKATFYLPALDRENPDYRNLRAMQALEYLSGYACLRSVLHANLELQKMGISVPNAMKSDIRYYGRLLHDVVVTPSAGAQTVRLMDEARAAGVHMQSYKTALARCAVDSLGLISGFSIEKMPGFQRTDSTDGCVRFRNYGGTCHRITFSEVRSVGEAVDKEHWEQVLLDYIDDCLPYLCSGEDDAYQLNGVLHPMFREKYKRDRRRLLYPDITRVLADGVEKCYATLAVLPPELMLSRKFKQLKEAG